MFEEERIRREKLEKLSKEQQRILDQERGYRQQLEMDDKKREEELAIQKSELDKLLRETEGRQIAATSKRRSNSKERRHILEELKKLVLNWSLKSFHAARTI